MEAARLRQEQEAAQQLQEKLCSLDTSIRRERDKVSPVPAAPCPPRCCSGHAAAFLCGHVPLSLGAVVALSSVPLGSCCGGLCPSVCPGERAVWGGQG